MIEYFGQSRPGFMTAESVAALEKSTAEAIQRIKDARTRSATGAPVETVQDNKKLFGTILFGLGGITVLYLMARKGKTGGKK